MSVFCNNQITPLHCQKHDLDMSMSRMHSVVPRHQDNHWMEQLTAYTDCTRLQDQDKRFLYVVATTAWFMAAELRTVPAVTFICRPCLRHLSRLCLLICRNVNADTAADTDDTLADGDDDDDKERGHGDTQHCHCLVTQYPTHWHWQGASAWHERVCGHQRSNKRVNYQL